MENSIPNTAYDQFAHEYDEWFDKHPILFQSELLALKEAVPQNRLGIEIGVGTGRFAQQLNIQYGVEPSDSMAELAKQRGVNIIQASAESLPIADQSFDFAAMITTVCFLSDLPRAFAEVYRILNLGGAFIVGLIDRDSAIGKEYEQQKTTNKFYKDAHFHSVGEIKELLVQSNFHSLSYRQTLITPETNEIEQPVQGYGKGSFVVIRGFKN